MKKPFPETICILVVILSFIIFQQTTPIWAQNTSSKKNTELFILEAERRLKNQEWTRAIKVLETALYEMPQDSRCWFMLSQAYEGIGNFQEALNCFKTAITLDPTFEDSEGRLQKLEQKAKDFAYQVNSEKTKARQKVLNNINELKESGKLQEAFIKAFEAIDADPELLRECNHKSLESASEFFALRERAGHRDALFYKSVFDFFRGEYTLAEYGLERYLASSPSIELSERAKFYLEKAKQAKQNETKDVVETNAKQETLTIVAKTSSDSVSIETLDKTIINPLRRKFFEELSTEDPVIIKNALEKLGTVTEKELELIIPLLHSTNEKIIIITLDFFKKRGFRVTKALPEIINLAKSETASLFVKQKAIETLGALRTSPDSVVPILLDFFNSDNQRLSTAAKYALINFGGDALPFVQEAYDNAFGEKKDRLHLVVLMLKLDNK